MSPHAAIIAMLLLVFAAMSGRAEQPRDPLAVARRVDQEIDTKLAEAKIPASPLADDAEFLRRVYLDITGELPNPSKAAEFLDSKDAEKRRKLIDELLASPG